MSSKHYNHYKLACPSKTNFFFGGNEAPFMTKRTEKAKIRPNTRNSGISVKTYEKKP